MHTLRRSHSCFWSGDALKNTRGFIELRHLLFPSRRVFRVPPGLGVDLRGVLGLGMAGGGVYRPRCICLVALWVCLLSRPCLFWFCLPADTNIHPLQGLLLYAGVVGKALFLFLLGLNDYSCVPACCVPRVGKVSTPTVVLG